MLGYSDNQRNRRKVAFLIRMATNPESMESAMIGINAHFEAFSAGIQIDEIPLEISEIAKREESILECYEATDDEDEKAKYEAMGALLGCLRQELKMVYLKKRGKGR